MEETVYTIRVTKGRKNIESRWKMTEAEAADHYAGQQWEIVPTSKEVRKTVDPWSTSMAHLQGPGSKG